MASHALSELRALLLEQVTEYAIVLLDPEGTIVWLSPSAEVLFGHTREKATGRKAHFLFVPEDAESGVFEHEMTTADVHGSMENDRWMLRADGSRFWANGSMFPMRGPDGQTIGYAKVLRDRTDLRQQFQTLRNEIAVLVESGRQKDKILAFASHELRNPLFATSVAVDALRRTSSGSPEIDQSFAVIDRQLQNMRRLMDDITDATQANAGKLKLKRERVDFRKVTQQALESMQPAIDAHRHVVRQILLRSSVWVDGDPDRLRQVVRNLIENAVKYTPPGGKIGIEVTKEGSEAVLKVEDNGIGVAPEMQSYIFELFTQVPTAEDADEKGLGIGLSLVKNLVMQHGGTIQVRSNGPGKGSEFTVRLPLAAPAKPENS